MYKNKYILFLTKIYKNIHKRLDIIQIKKKIVDNL